MNRFAKLGIFCLIIMFLLIFGNAMLGVFLISAGNPGHLLYYVSAITYPFFLLGLLGLIISVIGYVFDKRREKRVKN